ncbi:unnamed protein product (macronuclear) [Paramecium tetraurelia]|uniref:rRNA-processing protein FYV7 n=1 Tax=Paramecium tetraurelia TaxID=5888 RepID=A0D7J8_PARTE|nr:uncharacterized protein GSPATT00013982001 [Paramecium tetraurelia]CAK79015.1 unnamed protein product [Paramecium tetraurelia]|eukprot:XP_001446412.1 hypothetical protein (macronuclear) [Paramecium tetraurelia strain d4-2]
MDVNAILQERKRLRIQKEKIRECTLQRKFRQKEKYFNQELNEKLEKDILAEKKQSFYKELFEQDNNQSQENQEIKPNQNQKQNSLEIKKNINKKKERKQIKKVFTQKNAKGQPILKNYLNLMIKKIEKEKATKN